MSLLDIMMCIFICLGTVRNGELKEPYLRINLSICFTFLALISCFILLVIAYGFWRKRLILRNPESEVGPVSEYICTLYEGANLNIPGRTTIYLLAFISRQIVYAATIVFLYEDPVF